MHVKGMDEDRFREIIPHVYCPRRTKKWRRPPGYRENRRLHEMINDSDFDGLLKLPGVGKVTAKAILKALPFKRFEELANVKGIGKVRFRKISQYLRSTWDPNGLSPNIPPYMLRSTWKHPWTPPRVIRAPKKR